MGDTTFLGLRGQHGAFLVDQETVGASISLQFEGAYLLAGVERMKMPSSVSLDGAEDRASAGPQLTTLGTVAIGTKF